MGAEYPVGDSKLPPRRLATLPRSCMQFYEAANSRLVIPPHASGKVPYGECDAVG